VGLALDASEMTGPRCFGILVGDTVGRVAQDATIADIAGIARHPTPRKPKRAFRGLRSSPGSAKAEPYHG